MLDNMEEYKAIATDDATKYSDGITIEERGMVWTIDNSIIHLKDILLLSRKITNAYVISQVPYSRFRSILQAYLTLNGIFIDDKENRCDYFILTNLDNNDNTFKIVKATGKKEEVDDMIYCNCSEPRLKPRDCAECYKCQILHKNFTTKIK